MLCCYLSPGCTQGGGIAVVLSYCKAAAERLHLGLISEIAKTEIRILKMKKYNNLLNYSLFILILFSFLLYNNSTIFYLIRKLI